MVHETCCGVGTLLLKDSSLLGASPPSKSQQQDLNMRGHLHLSNPWGLYVDSPTLDKMSLVAFRFPKTHVPQPTVHAPDFAGWYLLYSTASINSLRSTQYLTKTSPFPMLYCYTPALITYSLCFRFNRAYCRSAVMARLSRKHSAIHEHTHCKLAEMVLSSSNVQLSTLCIEFPFHLYNLLVSCT